MKLLCHVHVHVVALQAVVEHLPKSLLLCREARAFTLDLMPVDILDLLEFWPLLNHYSLLVVLAGIMEEPHRDERVAQNTFVQSPCCSAGQV